MLKQSDTETRVDEICRKFSIGDVTFYKWHQKYASLEHGFIYANQLGAVTNTDGCVDRETQRLGHHSLGSGQPIRLQ